MPSVTVVEQTDQVWPHCATEKQSPSSTTTDSERSDYDDQYFDMYADKPVEIAFSASAGVFVYQMGVAAYLQDHFELANCRFSGCSGGSWAATLLAAHTSAHETWQLIQDVQSEIFGEYKWYNGYFRYAQVVRATISRLWGAEDDVCERVRRDHSLKIAVTKFPSFQGERHDRWHSVDDLADSIIASSFVPMALSGKPWYYCRGQRYIDGAFTNFKGVDSDEYTTWKDVWFHTKNLVSSTSKNVTTSVGSMVLPTSWSDKLNQLADSVFPAFESPHEAISNMPMVKEEKAVEIELEKEKKLVVIKPWLWSVHAIYEYHLSVNVDKHQKRFDLGYEDASKHHDELKKLLPELSKEEEVSSSIAT